MCGAVVIPHGAFGWTEAMHNIAAGHLFKPNEIEDKFQEFHAFELFNGDGAFKGIPEPKRFEAIRVLLTAVGDRKLPFIYAAIDVNKLAKSEMAHGLFETARPLIPAFKMCLLGVEEWAQNNHPRSDPQTRKIDYDDQYLLIVDETNDSELKKGLKNSYRKLRASRPMLGLSKHRLWHAHDAMYFGDSRDSVGIQLADLCTYFMQRRLLKRNLNARDKADEFYEMFSPHIICAKPEPEWNQYGHLFCTHEGQYDEPGIQNLPSNNEDDPQRTGPTA